ncbi:hypothetical protein [Neomoorella thermoacetica]|uniref:hypothetical protein n=1 Tax=Neomoorella thermoacetica TaxID=1525 RepID=UPI00116055F1|nr:hypothetical protein [Moorella thermoacetica]
MPNKEIDCEFQFHNVGQGLFYTGSIGDFRFIYDCGSLPMAWAHKAVSNYLDALTVDNEKVKPVINLLVLSHLDLDHVSGIDNLLCNTEIKIALIPYTSPLERLLLAVRHSSNLFGAFTGPYSLRREDGEKKPGANLPVKHPVLECLAM